MPPEPSKQKMRLMSSVNPLPAPSIEQGNFPLDRGSIYFRMHRADADAEFLRCRVNVDKKKLVNYASDGWQLDDPGVLIRICGTTPGMSSGVLDDHADFTSSLQGVLKAASTASAWLTSTGLNFGMGEAVGTALGRSRHHCGCPLIGFAEWGVVQGAEQIITGPNGSPGLPGSKRVYTDVEPDADMSTVSLQANHSHFVLVGGEGDEGFVKPDPKKARKTLLLEARQRSFNFAHHFEEAVAMYDAEGEERDERIPRILTVLCGDETTLEEVINFCRIGSGMVFFVTCTGGLAEAIAKYVYTGTVPADWAAVADRFAELQRLNVIAAEAILKAKAHRMSGTFDGQTSSIVASERSPVDRFPLFSFGMKRGAIETSTSLLDALMQQIVQPRAKVHTAVEWDDSARLAQIFATMVPAWLKERPDILRSATQLALAEERVACIKVLVDLAAPVTDLDLLALYDKLYDPYDPPRFPMFLGCPMPTTTRTELRASAVTPPHEWLEHTGGSSLDTPDAPPAAPPGMSPRFTKENPIKAVDTQSRFRSKSKETPVHSELPKAAELPRPAAPALARADSLMEESGGPANAPHIRRTDSSGSGYSQLVDGPIEEEVYKFYPPEVWKVLGVVVPGLTGYWLDTIRKKEEAAAGDGDGADLAAGGKIGARWVDIYVWAVLLGNDELATTLLPACQEPMRAAVLGSRIFSYMATRMPLNALTIKEMAASQEQWAVGLLDLCDNFQEARRMLITPSSQWKRTVLHLALQSELRDFCAHHHCQTLCDEWLRGNQRTPGAGPKAVLKRDAQEGLFGMVKILVFAVCPSKLIWGSPLEWALPAGLKVPPADSPPAGAFYTVPVVKGTVRLFMHLMYVAFMSITSMETKREQEHGGDTTLDFHAGGGQERPIIWLISWVWTCALALDEWYKYIQQPATFQADFWNQFDYISISMTLTALILGYYNLELEMEVLAFALLFIWCRIFKYLTSNQSIGLLIIMIQNMFKDIVLWALVSVIFLAAYTVAFVTISDPSEVDYGADTPITAPIWAMLGSFDNQEVGSWNGNVGQTMLWSYLVVSNILLVNLLIAMMGDTFGVIKEMADQEWKFGRLLSVVESTERMSAIPPPFNLPVTLSLFVWTCLMPGWLKACLKSTPLGRAFDVEEVGDDPAYLKAVTLAQEKKRRVARRLLLALKASQEEEETTSVLGRLQVLSTNVLEIEENLAEVALMVDTKGVRSSGTADDQQMAKALAPTSAPVVPLVRTPAPGRLEAVQKAKGALPVVAEG